MKSVFTICLCLLSAYAIAQNKGSEILIKQETIVCYSSDEHLHEFSPVAELTKQYGKSGNTMNAVFDITYENVPASLQAAVEEAARIMGTYLKSDVTIHASASYSSLGEGVLASAGFNLGFTSANFVNTPQSNVWYPIPLIEKLRGQEITGPSDPDIFININSTTNWYTDFNNPNGIANNEFDLVTVMLHELMHGLGFSGDSNVTGTTATYSAASTSGARFPFVFDSYVTNSSSLFMTDVVEDQSAALASFLQSGNVFFKSPSVPSLIKLFTPNEWNGGSSLYHLDLATFSGTEDRLMRPQISDADVNFNPGIAINMLHDMGWDFTRLDHQPINFIEKFDEGYSAEISIQSDAGFDTSSLALVYSQDFFETTVSVPLRFNIDSGTFSGDIPAPNQETEYQYYFEVMDNRGIRRSNPGDFGENLWFTLRYGLDMTAPLIVHTATSELSTLDSKLSLRASGSDVFSGIDSIFGLIKFNSDTEQEFAFEMKEDGFGVFWEGTFDFGRNLSVDDVLSYRLRAIDKSQAKNESFAPLARDFPISIREVPNPLESYTNDFNGTEDINFTGNLFVRSTLTGIDGSFLSNPSHPYPTAGTDNTINFISELNSPIIVSGEDDFIKFEEVVLVEPGENDATFGQTEFWDYVIVETKKISESEWKGLSDGYDCNQQTVWRNRYLSGLSGQLSTATPLQSLFRVKEYDFSTDGGYSAGDTIQIRFRLFSDPAAAGWGWAVDNLNIQDPNINVSVTDFVEENNFQVYPNPSNTGMITVTASFTQAAANLRTELTDIHGRLVRSEQISNGSKYYEQQIDVSSLPAGIYFMTLRDSESAITKKVVKY